MTTPKDPHLTRKITPDEWPEETGITSDLDALFMARLILDGFPRSYVEGARRLAQYVLDLNLQMGDIEDMAEILQHEAYDTLPTMTAAAVVGLGLDE
jgi:hypothetical protein